MSSTAMQARSLYRRLLRELPNRATSNIPTSSRATAHYKLSNPSLIQQRIRSNFSQLKSNNQSSQLQQAEQFVQYLQAQRMYATLIERYNPGMGMDEEERVRLTARRVGMDLPEEFLRKK
ncbi:hypothetical protein GQ43DRAFT_438871 [Delitschia confertaspora ATCC 74209]|uniref:Ras guanyl-nucleotide exchange factor RasGEF n=1 Tax=Delitschia confertaspora ATCC 74209 TaxID=1513339 RepID=A0A9P4MXL7_9PLEO|nr:hypothetical protein GQ43DRAFT_438871 [Delitschia confertaspora ATCC 74209]